MSQMYFESIAQGSEGSSIRVPAFPPPQFICSFHRVSQFKPQLWIRKQSSPGEARAEPGCTLPPCTALGFTKPHHSEARSKLLPFMPLADLEQHKLKRKLLLLSSYLPSHRGTHSPADLLPSSSLPLHLWASVSAKLLLANRH